MKKPRKLKNVIATGSVAIATDAQSPEKMFELLQSTAHSLGKECEFCGKVGIKSSSSLFQGRCVCARCQIEGVNAIGGVSAISEKKLTKKQCEILIEKALTRETKQSPPRRRRPKEPT